MSKRVLVPLESFSGGMMPRTLVCMALGPITTPLSTDLMILWANGSSSHSGEYVLLKYVDVL